MPFNIQDFHFIRPELLFLLVPAVLLILFARYRSRTRSAWQSVISPHLLPFLFVKGESQKVKSGLFLAAIISLLMIIALSGPSFRQKSVPVIQTENAQVILLDLSLSMDATDIKPSRLQRARHKLTDLLSQTKEGSIALVVYAGDAFVISPLTSDAKTIETMVPTLSTNIMPVLGSRPDLAINKSIELLKNAKYSYGQIIWLTDGVDSEFIEPISESINAANYELSILAIGTEQGAPIPLPDKSGFLKDRAGNIVVPKLQTQELKDIAANTDSGIVELTADSKDIDYLVARYQGDGDESDGEKNEQLISRWIDDGYWLIWIVLGLFLVRLVAIPSSQLLGISFVLFSVSVLFVGTPTTANALEWKDIWLTKQQQAKQAFSAEDYEQAAELFKDPSWKAASQYKSGQYEAAANSLKSLNSAESTEAINAVNALDTDSLYNYATSLAKAGKLEESLESYDQLLKDNPEHEDGQFNKKIVEEMLKQQQEQQQQEQEDKENQEQQEQDNQQQQDSNADQEQQEQQQQEQEQQEQQEQTEAEQQQAEQEEMELTEDEREQSEKDQALEHWLEKIPDDPGGLLRRKMYREYQRRGREQKEEKLW